MEVIDIGGNLESLKQSVIEELEALYELEADRDEILSPVLADRLAVLTGKMNREIAVYINRKGKITAINVGDSSTVSLAEVEGRRGGGRLSGIRCIHTHPNGDARLSEVDISSLLTLKLDAMLAVGAKDGHVSAIYAALPAKDTATGERADIFGPFSAGSESLNLLQGMLLERDRSVVSKSTAVEGHEEKALLVGLETSQGRLIGGRSEGERSLDELEELAVTAGVKVLKKMLQKRTLKDSAYYIGRGKVEELNLIRQALDASVIIFDDELSGAQFRNIEEAAGVKVIDRTTLILDIFAQRARSSEGKLQVELAQLKYRLPRLVGFGQQLSRLGGGIGTRGPGEKKLEVDRRHIRRRIKYLEQELEGIGRRRQLVRTGRSRNEVPAVALVGYTNAGKSTLLNALCSSDVFAEDKLFATLDTTTRRMALEGGRQILLTDTVGFIRKLPHELVEAFKSSLEEAVYADALIHVVDASEEEIDEHMAVVEEILHSLGAFNKPVIIALNKIDRLRAQTDIPPVNIKGKVCAVSALTGQGLDSLAAAIAEAFPEEETELSLLIPYSAGWAIPYIHENGKLLEEEFVAEGTKVRIAIKKGGIERLKEYVIKA